MTRPVLILSGDPAAHGVSTRMRLKMEEVSWYPVARQPLEWPRRLLDVMVSMLGLVIGAPLLLCIGLLIRLDSKGPVIYRQTRVGQHGRHFTLFKFRGMVADAEKTSGPCWARPRDPRVTRVGKVLRVTRLDELPQLANVLRGDMSLVGPRPERPFFAEQLATLIPGYRERYAVRPGITGWAQINYPYGASVHEARVKLSYDLFYVENRDLLFDLRILLATIPVVLLGRGAR